MSCQIGIGLGPFTDDTYSSVYAAIVDHDQIIIKHLI